MKEADEKADKEKKGEPSALLDILKGYDGKTEKKEELKEEKSLPADTKMKDADKEGAAALSSLLQ